MGWIFFFFPWGINKKNPPNYPPKMSENHLISPLQHCCPSVFSCLCFPQFHQKSSSSPVFPHSGPSPPLPGVNMSHWGNACEHSQNQRWVRQKTVIWARFREWPVIAGFRNSLKQRHVWRAYDVMRRTRLVRRWVSYFFDGRKHGRAFCVLLAVTDGFKHDVLLRMCSMFPLGWPPPHSSSWRVFAAGLSPSTWLMLRCGREGLIKVTQSESNQIWGRVQKLRGWRSRDWSVGVREWQVMLCYVQQTIIAYMDDVALWVCAHLESSHKFSFFPRVTEIFSECI